MINQARRLRFVAVAATGTDNVDLEECRARGIVVSNIRNYAVNTVPEHTFALMREGLVDEAAVGPALEDGQIGGAGFDVVSVEPPAAARPTWSPD